MPMQVRLEIRIVGRLGPGTQAEDCSGVLSSRAESVSERSAEEISNPSRSQPVEVNGQALDTKGWMRMAEGAMKEE